MKAARFSNGLTSEVYGIGLRYAKFRTGFSFHEAFDLAKINASNTEDPESHAMNIFNMTAGNGFRIRLTHILRQAHDSMASTHSGVVDSHTKCIHQ